MNIQPCSSYISIPITFRIAQAQVQYSIPTHWSINKTKCLLVTEFPKLKFNDFELMYSGQLLKGCSKINQISKTDKKISLIAVNVKSQIKFQEYYQNIMRKSLRFSLTHDPVMDPNYQKTYDELYNVEVDEKQLLNINHLQIMVEERDGFAQLFEIFYIIGMTLFMTILLEHGEITQILSILLIYFLHVLIDVCKSKFRKKEQNNQNKGKGKEDNFNVQAQKSQGKNIIKENVRFKTLKACLYLRFYKSIEVILYFMLSFYPNWDIKLHFNIFGEHMKQWRDKINNLKPETYPEMPKTKEGII